MYSEPRRRGRDPKEISLSEARRANAQLDVGGELLTAKPTAVLSTAAQDAKADHAEGAQAERATPFLNNGRAGELVNCIASGSRAGRDYGLQMN